LRDGQETRLANRRIASSRSSIDRVETIVVASSNALEKLAQVNHRRGQEVSHLTCSRLKLRAW
jgi:hypothetical protein